MTRALTSSMLRSSSSYRRRYPILPTTSRSTSSVPSACVSLSLPWCIRSGQRTFVQLRPTLLLTPQMFRAIDQAGGSNIDASIVELSIFALNSLLVNDDCKWFAAEAGVVHPLMYIYETTPDQRLRRVSLALLLSLVECTRTQVAFARQGGVTLLRDMALSKVCFLALHILAALVKRLHRTWS